MKVCSFFLFAALTLSAAARTSPAIPVGAELDKFPTFAQPLTVGQIADLGLRPQRLEKEWTGYNLYHSLNRYVLETLPAGDLVLVDKTGAVRYRQLCGNRLVELSACPTCPAPPADLSATATGVRSSLANLPAKATVKPGLWSRLANAAWGFIGDILSLFWWLLKLLMGLALLGLLLLGLVRLWDWITNRNQEPQPQPVAQPNPAPAPLVAPVAPAPVPPAPQPQPPVVPVPAPPAPVAPQPVNPAPAPVAPQPQPAAQQGTFISVAMGERSMIRWSDDVTNVTYRRNQEGVHTLNWETNNNA